MRQTADNSERYAVGRILSKLITIWSPGAQIGPLKGVIQDGWLVTLLQDCQNLSPRKHAHETDARIFIFAGADSHCDFLGRFRLR